MSAYLDRAWPDGCCTGLIVYLAKQIEREPWKENDDKRLHFQ
jgi:hypothetical protein